jgi:hypothetical protein
MVTDAIQKAGALRGKEIAKATSDSMNRLMGHKDVPNSPTMGDAHRAVVNAFKSLEREGVILFISRVGWVYSYPAVNRAFTEQARQRVERREATVRVSEPKAAF